MDRQVKGQDQQQDPDRDRDRDQDRVRNLLPVLRFLLPTMGDQGAELAEFSRGTVRRHPTLKDRHLHKQYPGKPSEQARVTRTCRTEMAVNLVRLPDQDPRGRKC